MLSFYLQKLSLSENGAKGDRPRSSSALPLKKRKKETKIADRYLRTYPVVCSIDSCYVYI